MTKWLRLRPTKLKALAVLGSTPSAVKIATFPVVAPEGRSGSSVQTEESGWSESGSKGVPRGGVCMRVDTMGVFVGNKGVLSEE